MNPHGLWPPDFKSGVYTNFTTPAFRRVIKLLDCICKAYFYSPTTNRRRVLIG